MPFVVRITGDRFGSSRVRDTSSRTAPQAPLVVEMNDNTCGYPVPVMYVVIGIQGLLFVVHQENGEFPVAVTIPVLLKLPQPSLWYNQKVSL